MNISGVENLDDVTVGGADVLNVNGGTYRVKTDLGNQLTVNVNTAATVLTSMGAPVSSSVSSREVSMSSCSPG